MAIYCLEYFTPQSYLAILKKEFEIKDSCCNEFEFLIDENFTVDHHKKLIEFMESNASNLTFVLSHTNAIKYLSIVNDIALKIGIKYKVVPFLENNYNQ